MKKFLNIVLLLSFLFSMGNVYAINLNENDKVNEKQDLPIELLIDLNSVKKQLKE